MQELTKGDLIIYEDENSKIEVEAFLYNETIWLPLNKIAELFDKDKSDISRHINNIYLEGELERNSTVAKFATVQNEGRRRVTRNIDYYNLDMIIAVGYRANSKKATKFRQWATEILKSYIIKGYSINKEKLKNPAKYGKDYFDELLEIIKEIRTSERRFYQKVTDIFAECSIDYNKNSEIAKDFYATIQNKFHYAITNETAAEIIYHRASSKKEHMGLTSWKQSPDGKILKSDVSIAKNYLSVDEMQELNEIVSMYLDYATRQARRHIPMTMEDWASKLDAFLQFNDADILQDKGKVTAAIAKAFAESEFEQYRIIQDRLYQSDFDRLVADTEKEE